MMINPSLLIHAIRCNTYSSREDKAARLFCVGSWTQIHSPSFFLYLFFKTSVKIEISLNRTAKLNTRECKSLESISSPDQLGEVGEACSYTLSYYHRYDKLKSIGRNVNNPIPSKIPH